MVCFFFFSFLPFSNPPLASSPLIHYAVIKPVTSCFFFSFLFSLFFQENEAKLSVSRLEETENLQQGNPGETTSSNDSHLVSTP